MMAQPPAKPCAIFERSEPVFARSSAADMQKKNKQSDGSFGGARAISKFMHFFSRRYRPSFAARRLYNTQQRAVAPTSLTRTIIFFRALYAYKYATSVAGTTHLFSGFAVAVRGSVCCTPPLSAVIVAFG